MATFQKFNVFAGDLGSKIHNLNTDALSVMLTNTAPAATNAVKADIAELASGSGYTVGGTGLVGVTWTQVLGLWTLKASQQPLFTSTGTLGPFRYPVLYNATPAAGNLIGWWDIGSSQTLLINESFVDAIDLTLGIFTIQ